MELKVEQFLEETRRTNDFVWMSIINTEGLAVCQSGTAEQFELAALLPEWVRRGEQIANASGMEAGLGIVCIVPKGGPHALLLRGFDAGESHFILLVATVRVPSKAAQLLSDVCGKLAVLI